MMDSIKISIPTLLGLGLNANQYMHLALLYHYDADTAKVIAPLSSEDFKNLCDRNFISIQDEKVSLLERGSKLFGVTASESDLDKNFKELYETYPQKVPSTHGGYRILRGVKLDSKDAELCKSRYQNAVSDDPKMHARIMRGLRNELKARNGIYTYMQELKVYLNQRSWEKYEDLDFEDSNSKYESI